MPSITVDQLQVLVTANTAQLQKSFDQINGQLSEVQGSTSKFSSKSAALFGVVAGASQALAQKGISLITSSIGDAAKRIDTLNNSNRVFQNMGFSAGDTKKQMDFLNKSILGLPTALNDAVGGVEALASVSGNLEDSTKTYKALNDGILAFGGSADMVNGAVLQLSQLPMDGPLDAQTWNSLRQNGLTPVFAAMAKDSDKTISQLKSDFGSGKLTVQDFTNELQKLDKDGGGGMASLEKQARDATSGIQTGWANMKTAIVRGVADIIKSVGSENVSKAISAIGKAFEKTLKLVGDVISASVSFIKDHMDTIKNAFKNAFDAIVGFFKPFVDKFKQLPVAIQLLISPIATFIANIKKIKDGISDFIKAIKNPVSRDNMFTKFGDVVQVIKNMFLPSLKMLWDAISKNLLPVFGHIVDVLKRLYDAVQPALTDVLKIIAVVVGAVLYGAFVVFVAVITIVVDALGFLVNILLDVVGWISNLITWIGDAIGFLINLGKTIVSAFADAWDAVKKAWSAVVSFFKGVWDGIAGVFKVVVTWFSSIFSKAWESVKKAWSAVTGFFSGVWNGVKSAFSSVGSWFGSTFTSAWNAVTSAFSKVTGFFTGIKNKIVDAFSGIGKSIGNFFHNIWDGVGRDLKSAINAVLHLPLKIPSIHIPHVGTIGGQTLIPQLAKGGVVDSATLALVGESGREAVMPLENNTGWIDELAGKLNAQGGGQHLTIKIGEDTILDKMIDGINGRSFLNGTSVLNI